jgi:hypothetical protein
MANLKQIDSMVLGNPKLRAATDADIDYVVAVFLNQWVGV